VNNDNEYVFVKYMLLLQYLSTFIVVADAETRGQGQYFLELAFLLLSLCFLLTLLQSMQRRRESQ